MPKSLRQLLILIFIIVCLIITGITIFIFILNLKGSSGIRLSNYLAIVKKYNKSTNVELRTGRISQIYHDKTNQAYYFIGQVVNKIPADNKYIVTFKTNDDWFNETNKEVKISINDTTHFEQLIYRQRIFTDKEMGIWKIKKITPADLKIGNRALIVVRNMKEPDEIIQNFINGTLTASQITIYL